MGIDTAIARWRRRRAALASKAGSTCTITRPAGPGTYDPDTRSYSNPDGPGQIYTGACIVRPDAEAGESDAVGQEVTQGRWVVEFHDLDASPAVGDQVHIDTALQQPQLAGQDLTVKSVVLDDWTVWPRLICTGDATRPAPEEPT